MSRRTERVNELIRDELSDLLLREVRDPRLGGLISITRVEVTPHLHNARGFVRVMQGAAPPPPSFSSPPPGAGGPPPPAPIWARAPARTKTPSLPTRNKGPWNKERGGRRAMFLVPRSLFLRCPASSTSTSPPAGPPSPSSPSS